MKQFSLRIRSVNCFKLRVIIVYYSIELTFHTLCNSCKKSDITMYRYRKLIHIQRRIFRIILDLALKNSYSYLHWHHHACPLWSSLKIFCRDWRQIYCDNVFCTVWQKWLVTQHSMLIWELFYFTKVWNQKSSLILAYHKLLGDVVTVTVKRRTLYVYGCLW